MSQRIAAVTGAASGIGRELALGLARRGRHVAICDVDPAGLEATRSQLANMGATVDAATIDVADRAAVGAWAEHVIERFGGVHELYNNAGVAWANQPVLTCSYAEIDKVLNINLWGVIHGTKEFLPHLIASGSGNLINISSLNGFFAQGQLAAYCASKFAIRGFTEAVRQEMLTEHHPVKVTVVHPGGIKTNIATDALAHAREIGLDVSRTHERQTRLYNDKLLRTGADTAARTILDGVAAGKERILIGPDAKLVDALVRLLPTQMPRIGAWGARRFADGD